MGGAGGGNGAAPARELSQAGKVWALVPGAAASPAAVAADQERRWDEIWAMLVGSIDARLRAYYGICEFCDDPACVLRLGRSPARAAVALPDGTAIRKGEPVGTLHFWNEHLPRYAGNGPELRWAADMRRRLVRSLRDLAAFVETDAAWREVGAFRGEAALSSRLGVRQLSRVTHRYGFEQVPAGSSLARRLHAVGECFAAWGLARAFNPAAVARQQFFRSYHEVWISRAALIERYGRTSRAAARARDKRE